MSFPITPIENQTYINAQGVQYVFQNGAWYVDSGNRAVQNYLLVSAFPIVGTANTIYLETSTGRMFWWDTILSSYTPFGSTLTVGDVKSALRTGDHGGWYRLNGRAISTLPAVAQANAAALSFTTNLPDASEAYLSSTNAVTMGAVTSANTRTLARNQLPRFTMTGTAASAGDHNHQMTLGYSSTYSGNQPPMSSISGPGGGTYPTNNAGTHTHSVTTENLNNNATQLDVDMRPRTMNVIMFVYLGA